MTKPLYKGTTYLAFFKNIDKTDQGCWEWTAGRDKDGYGQFNVSEVFEYRSHRAAYKLFIGDIPEKLLVLHSCNNPPCCNPEHLRVGTNKDNSLDCVKAGNCAGFKNGRCKINKDELEYIKSQKGIVGSRRLSKVVSIGRSQIENIWNGSHKYDQ